VAPGRGARPAAVEENDRGAGAGLVVVELEVAGVRRPARGLVGQPSGGDGHVSPGYSKRTPAEPRRSKSARTTSPALTGTDLSSAPDSRISPASSRPPKGARALASQATQAAGSPRAAAPQLHDVSTPLISMTPPRRRRSRSRTGVSRDGITNRPLEAVAATVSTRPIFQSAMRLSMISGLGEA